MGRIFPTCLMMKQPRLRHVGIWLTMPLITVGVCFASIHWLSQFLFLALKDHAGWTMFFFYLRELISGNMSKEPKDCRETYSQIKRRRMLQFDTQVVDSSLCSDEMPSPFLKSMSVRATSLLCDHSVIASCLYIMEHVLVIWSYV